MRHQRLPSATDFDKVIAVGAVAVKENDKLARPAGYARF
jgi:hypothetical protein